MIHRSDPDRSISSVLQVYTTLAAAVLISAVGVYFHTLWHIGGIITTLAFIGTSTWLAATPAGPINEVLCCFFTGTHFLHPAGSLALASKHVKAVTCESYRFSGSWLVLRQPGSLASNVGYPSCKIVITVMSLCMCIRKSHQHIFSFL